MARNSNADDFFGLNYLQGAGGELTAGTQPKAQQQPKAQRPMKRQPISPQAANSQRWNTTNRQRNVGARNAY